MKLIDRLCQSCGKNYFKCLPESNQTSCSRFCGMHGKGKSWRQDKAEKKIVHNRQSEEFKKADRDRAVCFNMALKYD